MQFLSTAKTTPNTWKLKRVAKARSDPHKTGPLDSTQGKRTTVSIGANPSGLRAILTESCSFIAELNQTVQF